MKKEIFNPGQPAKRADLDRSQMRTQEGMRERLLDLMAPGIIPNSQLGGELLPFYITPDSGISVKVGSGIAIGPNSVTPLVDIDGTDATNTGGERLFIPVSATAGIISNNYTNDVNGGPGTGTGTGSYTESSDGLGGWTATPQTTGTRNIPLVNGVLNYVWLSYLQTIDTSVTSLHKVTSAILYPSATDGYEIVVNQSATAPGADPRWILRGTVDLTSSPGAVLQAMITNEPVTGGTNPFRINFAYDPSTLAPATPPTPGTTISLEGFLNAKGTGTVTTHNILGLSLADVGYTEDANIIDHERFHHVSGVVTPLRASVTSALYPQIQSGGFGGALYTVGMRALSTYGSFAEELVVKGLVAKSGVGTPIAPAAPSPLGGNVAIGDPYVGFSFADSPGTYSIYVYVSGAQPTADKTTTFIPSPDNYLVCTVNWNGSVLSSLSDKRLFGTVGTANIQQQAVGVTELAVTGVTPGAYGSPTQIPQIAVGVDGRVTNLANVTISGVPAATVPAAGVLAGSLGSGVVAQQSNGLNSASTTVTTSGAAAPTTGQVLTATSSTTAAWQNGLLLIGGGTIAGDVGGDIIFTPGAGKLDLTGNVSITGNLFAGAVPAMIFGGWYASAGGSWGGSVNPLTGGFSCPAGFTSTNVFSSGGIGNCSSACVSCAMYICWK